MLGLVKALKDMTAAMLPVLAKRTAECLVPMRRVVGKSYVITALDQRLAFPWETLNDQFPVTVTPKIPSQNAVAYRDTERLNDMPPPTHE